MQDLGRNLRERKAGEDMYTIELTSSGPHGAVLTALARLHVVDPVTLAGEDLRDVVEVDGTDLSVRGEGLRGCPDVRWSLHLYCPQ